MPSEVEVEFESDSSTVVYDHEPFETFKARVLGLCQTVLISADDKISIELMYGGGFNRNIGVHVPCSEHTAISQYVLRIPRFEAAQLDRNLAPLQLLRQQSKIQIPEVIAFDTTRHNVLESPYMIQTRIPGSSLFLEYPDMPHEMKCSIAKELRRVYSELQSIRSVTAGRLTLSPSQGSLMIQPFHTLETDMIVPYENGLAAKIAFSTMRHAMLEHKKELAVAEGPNHSFRVPLSTSSLLRHRR